MMYRVIKDFTDLHDEDYPYSVGDIFPRYGITVTKERFDELSGSGNKQGTPLIKEEKSDAEAISEAIREGLERSSEE